MECSDDDVEDLCLDQLIQYVRSNALASTTYMQNGNSYFNYI